MYIRIHNTDMYIYTYVGSFRTGRTSGLGPTISRCSGLEIPAASWWCSVSSGSIEVKRNDFESSFDVRVCWKKFSKEDSFLLKPPYHPLSTGAHPPTAWPCSQILWSFEKYPSFMSSSLPTKICSSIIFEKKKLKKKNSLNLIIFLVGGEVKDVSNP